MIPPSLVDTSLRLPRSMPATLDVSGSVAPVQSVQQMVMKYLLAAVCLTVTDKMRPSIGREIRAPLQLDLALAGSFLSILL